VAQLVLHHLCRAGRLPWKEDDPRDPPGYERETGARGGARAGRAVPTNLRQVGQGLRRIADQLQLDRLAEWQHHEALLREMWNAYPLVYTVVGCALTCGLTALVNRALRQ